MSAGTIALTNNSATVTGTGTSFTTELKPGDFVYVTVGGTPYTLVASSVTSDTQLILAVAYDGPTTTGIAWNAVPASLQVAITQKILNDFAQVARGRILDFQNWQKIYSSDQSVTVTRPDRTTFTGPSWGYMATQFAGKANTADVLTKADNLNSLTDKATARTNLGLKGAAVLDVGTASGTVAAGNDSRIDGALQKSGGTMTGQLFQSAKGGFKKNTSGWTANSNDGYNYMLEANGPDTNTTLQHTLYVSNGNYWASRFILTISGNFKLWEMRNDGSFRSDGTVYASGTALTSDRRLKSNFQPIDYDIDIIDKIVPQRYDKGTPADLKDTTKELGIVAQDLQAVLPDLVSEYYWNEEYPDLLSINYSGLAAWLVGYVANLKDLVKSQGETITKQEGIISKMEVRLAELESRMKAIDGLDA